MKWKILIVVVLVSIAIGVVVEQAMTKTQVRSIDDISIGEAVGGTVAIEGEITYAKDNEFVLQDGTGKVELATCPTWYRQISLRTGDRVIAVGQVMGTPSDRTDCRFVLGVYKIMRNGEMIEVRKGPGKPPWLGMRDAQSASARAF